MLATVRPNRLAFCRRRRRRRQSPKRRPSPRPTNGPGWGRQGPRGMATTPSNHRHHYAPTQSGRFASASAHQPPTDVHVCSLHLDMLYSSIKSLLRSSIWILGNACAVVLCNSLTERSMWRGVMGGWGGGSYAETTSYTCVWFTG